MKSVATARSFLFVPGDRPDRFAKAARSGAEVVVIDLEDAVAPDHKPAARRAVAEWLGAGNSTVVRMNATSTADHDADLHLLDGLPGLDAVMVPMCEDPGETAAVGRRLSGVPLVALVETARGIHHALDLAAVSGVVRLAFGNLDFALDIDCSDDHSALLLARSSLVLSSRIAGLAGPVDGVTTDIRDPTVTAQDAANARSLGFTGKLCIHPSQIEPTHTAFSPSNAEVAWARQVLASDEGGASELGGRMIDAPVLARAARVAAIADDSPPPRSEAP